MQGICHLLTNIGIYSKESLSSCPHHEAPQLDNFEVPSEFENMDLENFVYGKVTEEIGARGSTSGEVPFHLHVPKSLFGLIEGIITKSYYGKMKSYGSICPKL